MELCVTLDWICASSLVLGFAAALAAESDETWISEIREDHPRLFLNKETWPEVKARALGPARPYYYVLKRNPYNWEMVESTKKVKG